MLIKILREIPKDKFTFIVAGPRRHYIINKCKKYKIPYIFIGNEKYINKMRDDIKANNIPLKKVNLLYNLIDVYLVSSKSEGGPKSILESAITKTLIFSTNVGLAPDILHKDLVFKEKEFKKIATNIQKPRKYYNKYINYNYQSVKNALDTQKIIKKINNILNEN